MTMYRMGRIHKYLNKVSVYQSRQVVRGKRQAWPGRESAYYIGTIVVAGSETPAFNIDAVDV